MNLLTVKPSRQMHIRRSSTENSKANENKMKNKTEIIGVLKKSDSFNSNSSNNPSKKGIKFSETNEVYSYNKNSPVDDGVYHFGIKQLKNQSLIKHQSSSGTINVEGVISHDKRERINLPVVMKLEAPTKKSISVPNNLQFSNREPVINTPNADEINSVIEESNDEES